jgi:hypothetical protein
VEAVPQILALTATNVNDQQVTIYIKKESEEKRCWQKLPCRENLFRLRALGLRAAALCILCNSKRHSESNWFGELGHSRDEGSMIHGNHKECPRVGILAP